MIRQIFIRVPRLPVTRRHYFLLAIIFAAVFFTSGPAKALSIDEMRLGVHAEKTRLVLDLSQNAEFRAFLLSDPYRIVIDLPVFEWRAGPVTKGAAGGIKAIRYGPIDNGLSRIVLDLAKPVSINSAFLLPKAADKPSRLVLDLAPSTAARFRNEAGKTKGNLKSLAPPTQSAAKPYKTASLGAAAPPPETPAQAQPEIRQKPLIVIDPGHGGPDSGAVGINGLKEKNVTLNIAKKLRDLLEDSGRYKVMLTRETDIIIPLRERVRFAQKHNADLFLSIHADSMESHDTRGASFYTLSEKASDAESEKLAANENKADLICGVDLSGEDPEVTNILVDLAMRDTMNQSKFFAGKLARVFPDSGVNLLKKPVRAAGFAVLKAPDIPSILVETGYLSNKSEAELLNTSSHRAKIAAALKKGIDAYFEQVNKNRRI